jgi:alpha-L-arabinofuranosidase
VMGGDGTGPREANTAAQPDRIKPRKGSKLGVVDGALKGELPAFSYNLVRLALD